MDIQVTRVSTIRKCRDHRGWGVPLVSLPSMWLSCNVSHHYCKCPLSTPTINPYLSLCTYRYSNFDIFLLQRTHVIQLVHLPHFHKYQLDGLKSMTRRSKRNEPKRVEFCSPLFFLSFFSLRRASAKSPQAAHIFLESKMKQACLQQMH